jgi:NhaP-type Na+/H+ and K+/H+ antiporter
MSEGGLFGLVEDVQERLNKRKNDDRINLRKMKGKNYEKTFRIGDIVEHKLNGSKYLIDKISSDGKNATVETENDKKIEIGLHKVKKVE